MAFRLSRKQQMDSKGQIEMGPFPSADSLNKSLRQLEPSSLWLQVAYFIY